MADYNVKINQHNGTSYDSIYPYTKADIVNLDDANKELYNVDTVDEALAQLFIGSGKYGWAITVTYPNGSPASGVTVNGVTTIGGGSAVTDSNGYVLGVSNTSSVTLSISSDYIDLQGNSIRFNSSSLITAATLSFRTYGTSGVQFTATGSGTISPIATRYDITVVGGGGVRGFSYWNVSLCKMSYRRGGRIRHHFTKSKYHFSYR